MENANFYVMSITKYNDGKADAKAIYTYYNETDALKVFHQKMASGMGDATCSFQLCHVTNDYGVVFKNEFFERASEEPVEE